MKKTMRLVGMALVAVVLSVNFAACSDDDDDEDGGSTSVVGLWKCIETSTSDDDAFAVGDAIKFFEGSYSYEGFNGRKCMVGGGGSFYTERGSVTDPTETDWNNNVEDYGDGDIEFDQIYKLSGSSLTIMECDLDRWVGTVSIEGDVMTYTYKYENWNYDKGMKTDESGTFTSKFKKQ